MSLKQLKKDVPFCRLIVSYADIDQNHLGTIYQATNWIYCGETTNGECHSYLINGVKRHEKFIRVSVIRRGIPASLENIKKVYGPDVVPLITKGKRKYLFPLDKEMRAMCEPLRKPYPKTDENWHKIDRNIFKKQDEQNTDS